MPTELGVELQKAKITGSVSGPETEEKTERGKRETGDRRDSEVGLR